jgi:hypothetical protein
MNNATRNIAIVLIVLFTAAFAGAQSASPLDAIVHALDRNTRAQIRTCEALFLQNQFSGSQHAHDADPPEQWQWRAAHRCWQ